MKKVIGIICLVIGILLLIWGHRIAESPNSTVQQFFTGAPSKREMYYYIAGVALTIYGVAQFFWPKKSN